MGRLREGANADIWTKTQYSDEFLFQENGIPIAADEQELKPRATFVQGHTSLLLGKREMRVQGSFTNMLAKMVWCLILRGQYLIRLSKLLQERGSSGDVFVNWKDLRDDPMLRDQYFQKVNVNGEKQWGDGVRVDPVDDIDFSLGFLQEWTVTSM